MTLGNVESSLRRSPHQPGSFGGEEVVENGGGGQEAQEDACYLLFMMMIELVNSIFF